MTVIPDIQQVKNNKLRDSAKKDREAVMEDHENEKENKDGLGVPDVLGEQEDQDVIF